MKSTFTAFLFIFCSYAYAQSDSIVRQELRKLQLQELPELSMFSEPIYQTADSAEITSSNKWLLRLDSLAADSTANLAGAGFIGHLELIFLKCLKSPNTMDYTSLKKLLDATKNIDTQTQYFEKLNHWLFSKFEFSGAWEQALVCSQRLSDANANHLTSKLDSSEAAADSLKDALAMQKTILKKTETEAEKHQELWMAVAAGIFFLLIVTAILFLAARSGMRKKMIEEVRKASDRTEIETVAKKLNEVRLECDQLKTGVKLSGEKVAVMEESRRKLIQNLKQLADEINAGLDEVKAQGETNKTGMNPTAYMAIQNAATRMGNTIAQRFQVLSDSLK
jgi:hypothetical protein